ncbi:hypothetical protein N665_0012s0132 [Sinapis alba]|nr:hypothetical protein N665_0012s0132 [Sinapis alba]
MASASQFMLEDQTDEDFFDKLVDDSYSPSEAHASSSAKELRFDDGSDSDGFRAFSNLSVVNGSVSDGDGTLNEADPGNEVVKEEPSSIALEEDVQFLNSDANKLSGDVTLPETSKESKIVNESATHGVKELDWGSFDADLSVNGGRGFGSYSDFFTELDGSAESLQGKAEVDVVAGGNLVSNDTNNTSVGSAGSEQHQGDVNHDSASGQHVDNSQSWENLYPGWKYDANTGQWYQVDGHDASMTSQESYGNSASNWQGVGSTDNSDVAYLRQSTASVVAGTAENVSTWNQVSQVSNGYPEHMVFDAQYPGWYYDTIAQEWRSLDSYNQASQTTRTGQAHDQQVQYGHALSAMYHNNNNSSMYNVNDTEHTFKAQESGMQNQHGSWDQAYNANNQQPTNTWESENGGKSEEDVTSAVLSNFGGNQRVTSLYSTGPVAEQLKPSEIGFQSFVPQHTNVASVTQNGPLSFSNDFYNRQKSVDDAQQSYQSNQAFSPRAGRSPDGRPPQALVKFAFGGKLIVMKDSNGCLQNSSFGSQNGIGGSYISLLNLAEIICGSAAFSSPEENSLSYFSCLNQQSLPGPLVGGNVGSKDLHKWFDERIVNCESSDMDFSRGKLLKMLLSLLRISCQYYGKLRSPFGTDATQKETDSAEAAVAKLFAFAKKDGVQNGGYAPFSQCIQRLPPESQMQVTASEVQNLLASGRKMEALQCAQEGHLWGPALVIATQLGQQLYVDTVKQMAIRQLVPGSPLRTLCLLVAGQPAEVFSTGCTSDMSFPASTIPQQQPQFGSSSMLDNWEENLGVITANRTADDELVITHLGDCMWKERGEIIAAHICYLIADTNFDPYSDSARLCLVGADHWKNPRTYASPEAIQRTELYEYSKTLGNSQYIMLPFQPYKVIYAHMLAEIGKLSAAQKYCQAVLKCLKTGRSPEVETWKQIVISLEERIRIHQQGGYAVNLAPTKLVGKLLNFFDSTANRVVGGMPPLAPHSTSGSLQVNGCHQQEATKLSYSQSVNTMSSLMPPVSMEPIHETGGSVRRTAVHTRSASEPNFGMTPIQDLADSSKEKVDGVTQLKSSGSVAGSRLSRFGFGMLKDTVGRVLQARSSKEAKLGAENQFYYDDKLKRWVEKGVEPPAKEAALPPPPTLGTYRSNSLGTENKFDTNPSGGSWSSGGPTPSENSSGIPPVSQGSNKFSARGRMGVRARYVDTFNQGRGNSQTMFQSPSIQSSKPPIPAKAKFFIPATPASSSNGQASEPAAAETTQEENSADELVASSAAPPQMTMQRFPSMDNMTEYGSGMSLNANPPPPASRRTASWSGNFNTSFTSPTSPSTFRPVLLNSSIGEELQEVEL